MSLLLKPNGTDMLTEVPLFVSGAHTCSVGSHSNSSKTSCHETWGANKLHLPVPNLITFIASPLRIRPFNTNLANEAICFFVISSISVQKQRLMIRLSANVRSEKTDFVCFFFSSCVCKCACVRECFCCKKH